VNIERWLEEDRKRHATEGCFWATNPLNKREEYCQYCGAGRLKEEQ
jgi:hypothetical protein